MQSPGAVSGRALRVTQVVFDLHGGGMETLVAEMIRRMAEMGVVSSVVTLSGRIGRVGAEVRPLVDQFHVARPMPGLSMVAPIGLARLIRRTRPDVVHLHSGAWYKGAIAARLAGAPRIVYTEHGREHHDPLLVRALDRVAARLTTVVVPVSERLRRYLHEQLGVPERCMRTIENGVDLGALAHAGSPAALRERFEIPADAPVVGSIGRLEPVKGYDRLLHVFASLRARGRLARAPYLLLCGDGSQRARLESLAEELEIRPFVRFAGWVSEPAAFYRVIDVFALTSHFEGLSVSLLEALASGVAPVVNDVGANAEVLGPGLSSQVVANGNWVAFATAVEALLADEDQRREIARRGRARVRERFDFARLLTQYLDVYAGREGEAPTPLDGCAEVRAVATGV